MRNLYIFIFSIFSLTAFSQSTFQKQPIVKSTANRGMVIPLTASIAYQGYDESQAYFGEGEYEIFLDVVDGVLDKPIIVLDGFDPGDERDINGLYNSLNFDGQNMADIIREEGFDIVILNAPQYTTDGKDIDGGADYIQRNAMVLIELINLLNAQKVGDEELVVLGPSMGGLIARYALAYMEQNSLETETRLYISFDSPHGGANIPVSLQYLINYLAEELGDADAQNIVASVLNSPAAKEMLIDHLLAHLLSGSAFEQDPSLLLPAGAPNFRDAFQAELDALGFPQGVRNVAMINGSGDGTGTGMAGMQVVDTNLDLGTGLTADVTLRFTPTAGQTNTVTRFQTFIAGIPVSLFTADAESFASSDGLDAAPGGTANISSALSGGGGNPVIIEFINALDQDDYAFIPTLSALAISSEPDWFAVPNLNDSPFVNIYIPAENESHVEVTQESAQFALDEIRDGALGILDVEAGDKYMITQNPVGRQISVKINTTLVLDGLEVKVLNMAGNEVLSQKVVSPGGEIYIDHNLSSGIYLVQISDTKGVYNLKIVVR